MSGPGAAARPGGAAGDGSPLPEDVEARIAQWRGYVLRRPAVSANDADELEDHLREQIADLARVGLAPDEAFLVAIRRMGGIDAISSEYAREHSDRLWKQLILSPAADAPGASPAPRRRDLAVLLGAAAGAGIAVKLLLWLLSGPLAPAGDGTAILRNLAPVVAPFLIGYFAWRRRLAPTAAGVLLTAYVALVLAVNLMPFRGGDVEAFGAPAAMTAVLSALHAPVVLWALVGVAYAGGRWRSHTRRMDFVRFTGELAVYYALIALGGAALVALTVGVFSLVGADVAFIGDWVLPLCVPAALLVAAWLVEAKQSVIENITPVLTRVFTPLTLVMLLALLGALATAGTLVEVDRELLILMDAILVLVLALTLYAISARDPLARPGAFDGIQLATILAAIAVDAIMLAAMLARIAEFGVSANKTAALGLNLLLLVHLAWQAWLTIGFLRGRPFARLERWQTGYLPLYAVWAAVVVVAFPPLFGFA